MLHTRVLPCFGVGSRFSPYAKRESQPIGLILGRFVGHDAIDVGGSQVRCSDDHEQ